LSWRGGRCHARNLQHHTLPARIYANEGLCQILLFQSDEVCETSYADRKGFRVALIAGENEFAKGTVQVKNLAAKSARDVPAGEVLAAVRETLGIKDG